MVECPICPKILRDLRGSDRIAFIISILSCVIYGTTNLMLGLATMVVGVKLIKE